MMKRMHMSILLAFFFLLPSLAQAQPSRPFEQFMDKRGGRVNVNDLRITGLEMSPDPVREDQWICPRNSVPAELTLDGH